MVSNYLSEEELKLLTQHSYKNGGNSTLDNYMDIFWIYIQKKIPKVALLIINLVN